MKKIITFLFLLMVAFSGYSQDSTTVVTDSVITDTTTTNEPFVLDTIFPQVYKVNGEVIGVLFSVEQAQKIDNDYEMYSLMDSIITQYGLNDSITVGIIDAQGKKITSLELQVDNLQTMLDNKDNMIDNRDDVISELKQKINLYEAEIVLRKQKEASYEEEIKALKKEVRRQKRQKVIGFITTGVGAVGIIVLGVLVGK